MRRRSFPATDHDREVPDVPVDWKRLLAYLRPYWKHMLVALLATVGSGALSLVFPWVIQNVIDSVLTQANLELLNQITVSLIFVFILRSLTSLVETYLLNYVGERLVVDVRTQLYRHLQHLSLGFFVKRGVGELASRMSNDVGSIRSTLTNSVNTFIQQIVIMIGSIIVMLAINWRLSLFIVALAPIIIAIAAGFGFRMRKINTEISDDLAGALNVATESLQNVREVKTFVREPYEIERHDNAINRAFRAALRLLRLRAVFGPLIAFLGFGGLSLVLWFGGREVIEGRLTGGQLISFLIYGISVAGSLGAMVGLYTSLQEALGATKRVFQLLDTPQDIQDSPNARAIERTEGRISFDNVHFSYDERQEVLHDIDLEIAPGEIIALVGPSGAGKSTIFNLIPRFYDPTEGCVRLDGQDLRELTQASLRGQIGIVPQEVLLFSGTIYENIRYGRLDATREEIVEAAQAANAHDFIMTLPDGYETVVGERGVRLSGGQRQRVSIARAILKNPPILLLDEATSSLDSESESLVQEALGRLMQERTTVIIAHRLSTTRVAHRIVVLDDGRIAEIGSHDALMAKDGLYARLYAMQFREDVPGEV
jgi:subfamily B ATP-binding cassette protein MsbA